MVRVGGAIIPLLLLLLGKRGLPLPFFPFFFSSSFTSVVVVPSSSFPVSLSPGGEEKRDGRPRKRRGPFPLSYPPKKCCSCRRRSVSPVFFVFSFFTSMRPFRFLHRRRPRGEGGRGQKKVFFVGGQWHITRIRRFCIQRALTCEWRINPLIYNIKFCHIFEGTPPVALFFVLRHAANILATAIRTRRRTHQKRRALCVPLLVRGDIRGGLMSE